MTAHVSFIDHRLGSEPNSNRQYMAESDNAISVESYVDSTHVNNKKFVPRAVESQTLLSTKGVFFLKNNSYLIIYDKKARASYCN